jgi:hypothetical protein
MDAMRTLIRSTVLATAWGVILACGGGGQSTPTTPGSAQKPAAAATSTVFSAAPAYASAPVSTTAVSVHAGKKLPVPTSTACLSCHKTGGTAPSFVLGGTVFGDDGKKPLADVEVRFVDDKGATSSVHSDSDGNFWLKGPSVTTEVGTAGARTSAKTNTMDPKASGNCNECHSTNMPMVIK